MKSLGLSKSSKASHSDYHSSSHGSGKVSSKKRARSISRSESPPPKRKHRSFIEDDDELDVSTEIWKMFGKNRNAYVSRDVLSDDEDMEADARALEQEELRRFVCRTVSALFRSLISSFLFLLVIVSPNARNSKRWKRNVDTKKRNGGERSSLVAVEPNYFLLLLPSSSSPFH